MERDCLNDKKLRMHTRYSRDRLPSRIHQILLAAIAMILPGCTAPPAFLLPAAILDPAQAGVEGRLQGEYATSSGAPAAQIVARGQGRFRLRWWPEGDVTGSSSTASTPTVDGVLHGQKAVFSGSLEGTTDGSTLSVSDSLGKRWILVRQERRSPTLGLRAPAGAVVLDRQETTEGRFDATGHLQRGARSREAFADARIHVEYRLPFEPDGEGQFRGNSGVYIQSRYEVQVLDSFGRPVGDREAGALYKQSAPMVNAALPPLVWQTYDIDFRAARFDATGEKIANARVTVRHNGVLVQDDTEILGPTGQGDAESGEPGRLLLQDHGNPVLYRNVWIERRGDSPPPT